MSTGLIHAQATVVDSTWIGGSANWNVPANWSPGNIPNNSTDSYQVIIDGNDGADSVVSLNTNAVIDNLSVTTGDTLNILNSRSLSLTTLTPSTALTNNGTINLNSSGSATRLIFGGDAAISGTGQIQLSNNAANQITTTGVLNHGSGHTIRGAGTLLNNLGGMINHGTIVADSSTTLSIAPDSRGFVNQGSLQATGSGSLTFAAGIFTNTGHTIHVGSSSQLILSAGTQLVGGTIETIEGGFTTFAATGAVLEDITLNGTIIQDTAIDTTIRNSITNNGTISLQSLGSSTDLFFTGTNPAILGSGEINLNSSSANRISGAGLVITHGADHTIRGSGAVLLNQGGMINLGTIIANQSSAMIIDPDANGFVNQGTIQATGSGGLTFGPGVFTNTDHTIEIGDGSRLYLSDHSEIIGGAINTTGTGYVRMSDDDAVLEDVTFSGILNVNNSINLQIRDGITNNGVINLQSSNTDTSLQLTGTTHMLNGTGEIVLGNNVNNRVFMNGGVITNGVSHTIRGAGNLLSNSGGMVNKGTIIGDQTNALVIDPDANEFENQGELRATGSGGITLASGIFTNSAGGIISGTSFFNASAATFTNAGVISPGTSPGNLEFQGDIDFTDSASLLIEIAGTIAGSEYDVLTVTGSGLVSLDGNLDIVLLGYTPDVDDEFTIMTTTGEITGTFDNVSSGVVFFSGGQFDVTFNSNHILLSNYSAVPEPHQWALLTSLAALAITGIRHQKIHR
ncbi:hypothetical protein GCM10007047_30170 [Cerasicoccus arenae]|uniref:Uncharacterized protein n=2 Tax=Cerasicoccus arenae TaxID=424488 RepID=A0A8J3DER9_9BACT|nr:hypothetical protein GCM10007047_30170 [Cerasicoccus arenae]